MKTLPGLLRPLTAGVMTLGLVSVGSAFEVPKPVINIPKPVINVPRPVINVPKPVINVPKPVVHVPKPVVNVPKPAVVVPAKPTVTISKPVIPVTKHEVGAGKPVTTSARSTITSSKPEVKIRPVDPKPDALKTVNVPKATGASTISLQQSEKSKTGGVPKPAVGAGKLTGLGPGDGGRGNKQNKPQIRAMSAAALAAGDDDDDDSGGFTPGGALRVPKGSSVPGKGSQKMKVMSAAKLAAGGGDDDDDDDSGSSLNPTGSGKPANAKLARAQSKPVIKAKAASKVTMKAASAEEAGDDDDDDDSGARPRPVSSNGSGDDDDDDDDSGGTPTPKPITMAAMGDDDDDDDSPGLSGGFSGSNGGPGNVSVSADGKSATATGPGGTYATATNNGDGSITLNNNNGKVTLTQQQLEAIAKGDMSSIAPLVGGNVGGGAGATQAGGGSSLAGGLNAVGDVAKIAGAVNTLARPVAEGLDSAAKTFSGGNYTPYQTYPYGVGEPGASGSNYGGALGIVGRGLNVVGGAVQLGNAYYRSDDPGMTRAINYVEGSGKLVNGVTGAPVSGYTGFVGEGMRTYQSFSNGDILGGVQHASATIGRGALGAAFAIEAGGLAVLGGPAAMYTAGSVGFNQGSSLAGAAITVGNAVVGAGIDAYFSFTPDPYTAIPKGAVPRPRAPGAPNR